jgi:hypothetical protein
MACSTHSKPQQRWLHNNTPNAIVHLACLVGSKLMLGGQATVHIYNCCFITGGETGCAYTALAAACMPQLSAPAAAVHSAQRPSPSPSSFTACPVPCPFSAGPCRRCSTQHMQSDSCRSTGFSKRMTCWGDAPERNATWQVRTRDPWQQQLWQAPPQAAGSPTRSQPSAVQKT